MSNNAVEVFTELCQFTVDPASVQLLPQKYCLGNLIVILGKVNPAADSSITVGCLDPKNVVLLTEVSALLQRKVKPVQLNDHEIVKAINTGHGLVQNDPSERLILRPVNELSFSPDLSPVQLLNEILGKALDHGATDIHFETYEDDVDVRIRVDGMLKGLSTAVDNDNIATITSRIKILAGCDIAERRRAQDGRIIAVYETDGKRRNIDFRVSVVPGPFGEDVVMRVLDSSNAMIGLDKLGFHKDVMTQFEQIAANPEGLILVTGPTGSGKTTTLYSALQRINTPENKILTVEDPIEYTFDKINQKQITPSMDFADYARSFMRHNPDVILIGEIRDEETAGAAMRAAQTGHLVLSTLHTNDAVRTVSRLFTLGIDAGVVSGSLLGAISQRLVRKLCEHCKIPTAPTEQQHQLFNLPPEDGRYHTASGCEACGYSGFKGRTGIYELFIPDDEIADMIASEQSIHIIRRRAIEKGMRSLLDDALDKARQGIIPLSEILRAVPYRIITAERELNRASGLT
ncbi:GspE/PulE family protein [Geomonas oryzisoli]|uniref:GspE/PulE family protein n=1 Tax=Geomonas oryzisoli TaxID=2847992 RepID=A0ABX8JEQ0_9BACT|nr:GspE/PulE family protein [Geomonas oryzisoli]QWV95124.1 GspE/PulE family protein [Geomonas oryzisoli]